VQRQVDRWAELRRSVFAPERILKRIDEMAALLDEAQRRNFQRWQILGRHINPNQYVGDSYEEEIAYLKLWIRRRISWIDSQYLEPPASARLVESASGKVELALKASEGQIYYTLDGSDPRAPGGAVSGKAQRYTKSFTVPKGGQVLARARDGNDWSGLATWEVPDGGAAQ
jgi:hypothetical protein